MSISQKPLTCAPSCPLHKVGNGFVHPQIGSNGILLLGEAPGKTESLTGKPFSGQAGYGLNKTLHRGFLRRADFSVGNVANCQPPKNWFRNAPWQTGAIASCDKYYRDLIAKLRPKVIVPMGDTALEKVLGISEIMNKRAPKRGYIYDAEILLANGEVHCCFALPTIHPASILWGKSQEEAEEGSGAGKLGPNFIGVQVFDFQKASRLALGQELTSYQPDYILHPNTDDLHWFYGEAKTAASSGSWLTADIETAESASLDEESYENLAATEIICISFSFRPGSAITVPWTAENLWFIETMLGLPFSHIVFWNGDRFDVPRLRAKGMAIRPKIIDGMFAWHFLQSNLPKSLGFVSSFLTPLREWKSLAEIDPPRYSCMDSDAALTNALAIHSQLSKLGSWDRYLHHYVELQPVLHEMGESGILIDPVARAEFQATVEAELADLDSQIQQAVPEALKPRKELVQLSIQRICPKCLGTALGRDKTKLKALKLGNKKLTDEHKSLDIWSSDPCEKCQGLGTIGGNLKAIDTDIEELQGYTNLNGVWSKPEPFNPNSTDQIVNYIQAQRTRPSARYPEGRPHEIPLDYKTGKPTTSKEAIAKLVSDYPSDPLYPLIRQHRVYGKLLTTYLANARPGPDGRLRTEFTQNPWTWRFASQARRGKVGYAAMQNQPKRDKMAKAYRKMFVAGPGMILAEADYSAIEGVLVGYFAKDPDYIRAAKLSIHGIMTSHLLHRQGLMAEPINIRWLDEKIMALISHIKRNEEEPYDKCKHGVHLSAYGGTPYRIHKMFPKAFPTVKDAADFQKLFFTVMAPKVLRWQWETLLEADEKCYLDTPFGYRMWFWDTLEWRIRGGHPTRQELVAAVREQLDRGVQGHKLNFQCGHANVEVEWASQAKDALSARPQNTAAAIIKESLRELAKWPVFRKALRLQIHDALLFELPDDSKLADRLAFIKKVMTRPIPELGGLDIGVEISVGKTWGSMKEWNSAEAKLAA